ncbi:hypothetical protein PILCRDRAFT_812626 [Piloderma croceum F 1598]|uniref:Uncharacterized protein n=1 Tax=Piloderma croceum (strain F 1598) TaxID=765440 RepID=A0A0C3GDQ7_PILCF|nr:hypothetical protein PILCRDRAFT_812626 [Piloderma croceum F 1598]
MSGLGWVFLFCFCCCFWIGGGNSRGGTPISGRVSTHYEYRQEIGKWVRPLGMGNLEVLPWTGVQGNISPLRLRNKKPIND